MTDWIEQKLATGYQSNSRSDLCQRCPQLGILHKNIGLIYVRKGEQQLQLALKLLPGGPDAVAAAETLRRRLTSQSSTLNQIH